MKSQWGIPSQFSNSSLDWDEHTTAPAWLAIHLHEVNIDKEPRCKSNNLMLRLENKILASTECSERKSAFGFQIHSVPNRMLSLGSRQWSQSALTDKRLTRPARFWIVSYKNSWSSLCFANKGRSPVWNLKYYLFKSRGQLGSWVPPHPVHRWGSKGLWVLVNRN